MVDIVTKGNICLEMSFCFNADDLSVNLTSDKIFFNQIIWVASSKES